MMTLYLTDHQVSSLVRALARDSGLTQEELGQRAGLHRVEISRLLGYRPASLKRLARLLGTLLGDGSATDIQLRVDIPERMESAVRDALIIQSNK